MILDAGMLIAFDRGVAEAGRVVAAARATGAGLVTTEPVVAQVWRSGASQALLAGLLRSMEIWPLVDGRSVGRLLAASGTSDVVDAHLVLLGATLGEAIVTGDPDDLQRLADSLGPAAPTIHAWP